MVAGNAGMEAAILIQNTVQPCLTPRPDSISRTYCGHRTGRPYSIMYNIPVFSSTDDVCLINLRLVQKEKAGFRYLESARCLLGLKP